MLFSRFVPSFTCFLLVTTSAYAMLEGAEDTLPIKGNSIPLEPEKELAQIPASADTRDNDFRQGRQYEEEGKYRQAAEAYRRAGVSGHLEAFIRLGYLYEGRHVEKAKEIEERRLVDAIAGYYIERGGSAYLEGQTSRFSFLEVLEEGGEGEQTLPLISDIENDSSLKNSEKFFKIAEIYEHQSKSEETISEKRLRLAYAGRYYEESALYYLYPRAFTALGHMYYFGKGIDISDMPLEARIQAKEYYGGGSNVEDPEARFMMGFLLEQEQTPEADGKAETFYQIAASQGYSPASFRCGVRYEQGQAHEKEVTDFYRQAEMYYTQVLEGEKPSPFIIKLVGMPEDVTDKVNLVKKLQSNPEGLETPTYSLIDAMFCEYFRKNSKWDSSGLIYPGEILIAYWVDLSLERYAHDHGLSYKKGIFETVTRVKNIARLLSGARPAQSIPDLTAYDQKLLNVQASKNTLNDPGAQQTRLRQIRQELSQLDEKWMESPSSNIQSHVHAWLDKIQSLVEGLHSLSKSFAGEPIIKAFLTRIESLPTADHSLNPFRDLMPLGYFVSLEKELETLKEEAQAIFKVLQPYQRSLSQQILLYKNLQEIKRYIGSSFNPELLQDVLLARTLMMEASKGDDQSEKIIKHFQSARALREYALSQNLSIEEAKKELDEKAREKISVLHPQIHDLSLIGYDVLTRLIQHVPSHDVSSHEEWKEASHQYREEVLVSLNQDDLDNSWVNTNRLDSTYFSGESDPSAGALTKLSQQAKAYIDEKEASLPPHEPTLKLTALTYEDPFIGLYGNTVPNAFKDFQAEAHRQYEQEGLGMSELDIYESLLTARMSEIRNTINSLIDRLPGINIENIDNVYQILQSASISPFQLIDRKQNLLFTFMKGADWQDPDPELIAPIVHDVIEGTGKAGRCPDGQADYFQTWIVNYILNHITEEKKLDVPSTLKVCLSLLFQNYKSTFIEKHASPFTIGGRGQYDANEDRTAMKTLLTQMLRLPLNLIGSFSAVLYPDFAIRTLENPKTSLHIRAIMERFLEGGTITYKDYRVTNNNAGQPIYEDMDEEGSPEPYQVTISFEGLTLKTVGRLIREATIPTKDRKTRPLPGLLPTPSLSFLLPEKLVEDFLQYDPVIASFFSTFIHSGYTDDNIFFDSKAAFEKGYHLQYILKDAAILRMLEVGGYARVPEEFYQRISPEWKFD